MRWMDGWPSTDPIMQCKIPWTTSLFFQSFKCPCTATEGPGPVGHQPGRQRRRQRRPCWRGPAGCCAAPPCPQNWPGSCMFGRRGGDAPGITASWRQGGSQGVGFEAGRMQHACGTALSAVSCQSPSLPQGLPLAAQQLAYSQAALLVIVGASAGRGRGSPAGGSGGGGCRHSAGANPAGGAGLGRNSTRSARRGAHRASRQRAGGKEGRHCLAHGKLAKQRENSSGDELGLQTGDMAPPCSALDRWRFGQQYTAQQALKLQRPPMPSLACLRPACLRGLPLPHPILCPVLQLVGCQRYLNECTKFAVMPRLSPAVPQGRWPPVPAGPPAGCCPCTWRLCPPESRS